MCRESLTTTVGILQPRGGYPTLSIKTTNPPVIQLHKERAHIRTEIVILSPIENDSDFRDESLLATNLLEKVLIALNQNVGDVVEEAFASDIESIYSVVHNLGTHTQREDDLHGSNPTDIDK